MSLFQFVTDLLLRNDPLDAVWRESEMALDFARKAKFRRAADIMVSQQRFIATMLGRTTTLSTFSDAQFDEATFEAQLRAEGMSLTIAWYWILKLEGAVPGRRIHRGTRGSGHGQDGPLGFTRPHPVARLLLLRSAYRRGAL